MVLVACARVIEVVEVAVKLLVGVETTVFVAVATDCVASDVTVPVKVL